MVGLRVGIVMGSVRVTVTGSATGSETRLGLGPGLVRVRMTGSATGSATWLGFC